jgi:hypothetical protein
MSVTLEPRLRTNQSLPDTASLRTDLADQVIDATRITNPGWAGEVKRLGEDYVIKYLTEVIACLPDDDILELAYMRDVGSQEHLSAAFVDRLTAYNHLARRIDQIQIAADQS